MRKNADDPKRHSDRPMPKDPRPKFGHVSHLSQASKASHLFATFVAFPLFSAFTMFPMFPRTRNTRKKTHARMQKPARQQGLIFNFGIRTLDCGILNGQLKPGLKTPGRFTCFKCYRRFISFIRFKRFRSICSSLKMKQLESGIIKSGYRSDSRLHL